MVISNQWDQFKHSTITQGKIHSSKSQMFGGPCLLILSDRTLLLSSLHHKNARNLRWLFGLHCP
jgi:hypothetical protein